MSGSTSPPMRPPEAVAGDSLRRDGPTLLQGQLAFGERLTDAERSMLRTLKALRFRRGDGFRASNAEIAREYGCCKGHAKRLLRSLDHKGHLTRDHPSYGALCLMIHAPDPVPPRPAHKRSKMGAPYVCPSAPIERTQAHPFAHPSPPICSKEINTEDNVTSRDVVSISEQIRIEPPAVAPSPPAEPAPPPVDLDALVEIKLATLPDEKRRDIDRDIVRRFGKKLGDNPAFVRGQRLVAVRAMFPRDFPEAEEAEKPEPVAVAARRPVLAATPTMSQRIAQARAYADDNRLGDLARDMLRGVGDLKSISYAWPDKLVKDILEDSRLACDVALVYERFATSYRETKKPAGMEFMRTVRALQGRAKPPAGSHANGSQRTVGVVSLTPNHRTNNL